MELYASDNLGVYIPQHFAKSVHREYVKGVSTEDWAILEDGPDHAQYWDAWDEVERNAEIHAPDGRVFTLWQNGDLWLIERGEEIPEDFRW